MLNDVQAATGKARIAVNGRFDFSAHRDFKRLYDAPLRSGAVNELEIDMAKVEYLDSSGLGMLLMLKEIARSANKTVALTNCRGATRLVLDIANFGQLIPIR
ncbi:MAG TPA: STAS domain-containing protein [Burkholderiales bacterium]|nr:STAS domain-containing protein [Burkholderiales bacterium]